LLCLELGRLATRPPRGLRDRTPAPPPPTYAVAPSVGSEATTARGEQAGRRNPRAATGAHRGPPRGSGALPGGDASGRHARYYLSLTVSRSPELELPNEACP